MTFKKINLSKFLFATLLSFGICSNLTYAASCDNDVREMYAQIERYDSITSTDHHKFTSVYSATDQGDNCYAGGYFSFGDRQEPHHICSVKWMKGNWGNTLACI